MKELIGNIIIGIGLVFILIGVFGLYRFRNFYSRILIGAKIDTVGFITICIGVIVRSGITWFSLKVVLLIAVVMIINPVVTHTIAHSAYYGGHGMEGEIREYDADN